MIFDNICILNIFKLDMNDEGIYICLVINFVGKDIILVKVIVIGEGKVLEFIKVLENIEIIDGSFVWLEVRV